MLTQSEKEQILQLTNQLKYRWDFWARPEQLPPPGNWLVWLILAGRGWGKTRTGAEFIKKRVLEENAQEIIIAARTPTELREYCIEGKSGILNVFPPNIKPIYKESKSRIEFHNGAIAHCYAGETPDKFRGGNPDTAWFDELVTYQYMERVWESFIFSIRTGIPKIIITTTPKPVKLLEEIMKDKDTYITRGSSYDNIDNLSPIFVSKILDKYKDRRIGRQEIYAEILQDIEGALWKSATLAKNRVTYGDLIEFAKRLKVIKIGVDPAASSGDTSDETGIIVGGLDKNNHGYTLEDCSLVGTPTERANIIKHLYYKYGCNEVVAEANNGGDMVKHMIQSVDNTIPVKMVHASNAKFARAEPIAGLDEQGRISMVNYFPELEDELTKWTPKAGKSPNRLDAYVWLWSDLLLDLSAYDMGAMGD